MSLDTTSAEADILARLETIVPRVYTTEVPDGISPVYPLIVVYFGDPIRIGTDRGIVSTRNDTLRGYGLVQVQAPTDAAANAVKNRVRNALTGYRPTDCGEMMLEGGFAYSRSSGAAKPTLYYREVAFSWLTNLSWVGTIQNQ